MYFKMRSTIFFILICYMISSGFCIFGIGEDNKNNTEVTENGVLFNTFRITSLKHPKHNTCGLKYGGAIVQLVALPYISVEGLNWYDTEQCMIFTDRFNATICCYHKDVAKTVNYYIKELENMEIAAVFGVKGRPDKFVIAANQSIYLLTNMIKNFKWAYSFKELIKVTDDSKILTEAVVTKKSHIIIGTKPSNYNEEFPNIEKGNGEILIVDLENKNYSKLEDNYSMISGVAMDYKGHYRYHADIKENKIWRRKMIPDSQLELVFDMSEYKDTVLGQVSAITLDKDDKLWIALLNSYQVIQFDIKEKRIIRKIPIAAPAIFSLAWGGLWYETLYAGTGSRHVDIRAVPAAGTLIGISGIDGRGWAPDKVIVAKDWL